MKVTQVNNNGGGGLGLVIAAGAVAAAVGAFDWIGQHGAEITSGIGVLVKVIAAVAVLAGAAAGWLAYSRHRQAATAAAEQPQPVTALPEQVPAQVAEPAHVPAIEPPRVYINVTDEQLAAILRHRTEEE